jgi:hypothetical protein
MDYTLKSLTIEFREVHEVRPIFAFINYSCGHPDWLFFLCLCCGHHDLWISCLRAWFSSVDETTRCVLRLLQQIIHVVTHMGSFSYVFNADTMIYGFRAYEHDSRVLTRLQGVSYVRFNRLSVRLLRRVPF